MSTRLMLVLSLLSGLIALPCRADAASAAPKTAPAVLTAVVTQDRVALRAEARDSARQHAVLWRGDSLEIRGQRMDFLQVYDHRRERAGFVRASQVRLISLQADAAPELLAVLRFLEQSPGMESLGIAYAAAYLRAAPADSIGAESLSALGTLADRLAHRASTSRRANDDTLAAHLDVVAHYGIRIGSFTRADRAQLCYDGEAFRRVLALPATAEQKLQAALALTRPECVDPGLSPLQRHQLDDWRAQVLDRVPQDSLPEHSRNRWRMRSAAVWAAIAFQRSRRGEATLEAGQRAIEALAAVNLSELAEDDAAAYNEAALRVGASRWAAEPALADGKGLRIQTEPGAEPGQTCVKLIDSADPAKQLAKRCTFATVWAQSMRVNAQKNVVSLAVQPLESWRELWLFQQGKQGWSIEIVPPASDTPDLAYIEFAGWVPGTRKLLTARESRIEGNFSKHFELRSLDSLAVDKQADNPAYLSPFYRWQDAAWKKLTVALR